MGDDQYTLSRQVCQILARIGLSADVRQARTDTSITTYLLPTLAANLLEGNKLVFYILGSSLEATTTHGLGSDTDILYCDESALVVDDLFMAPQHGECLLMVRDSHTAHGYCKLQFVEGQMPQTEAGRLWQHVKHGNDSTEARPTTEDGRSEQIVATEIPSKNTCYLGLRTATFAIDKVGRVVRSQHCIRLDSMFDYDKRCGPAYTSTFLDEDRVPAVRCGSWPNLAQEWLTRNRRYHWPSQDQINELPSLGCLLVPVGHSLSPEKSLEWRISFSLQERALMLSLSTVQNQCYVLMKLTKKDLLQWSSITSYHCKTVLLYVIEDTPTDFWVPDNLIKCFLRCLERLHACVKVGFCPSYFLPKVNLFARNKRLQGDLRTRVADRLHELLETKGKLLFRIRCDDVGTQLMAMSYPEAYPTTMEDMSTKYARIVAIIKLKLYNNVAINILEAVNCIIYAAVEGEFVKSPADSVRAIRYRITQLENTASVTEHTQKQTREAVQYMLPFIHTSLASHLAARILQKSRRNANVESILMEMYEHVRQGSASKSLSCELKVATLHYMLEEVDESERILADNAGRVQPFVYSECACLVNLKYSNRINEHLLDKVKSVNMSCADFVTGFVHYCVSFMPTEMEVIPAAMKYELFKSSGIPLRENRGNRTLYWYPWSNVDANVHLYYMQYLVYDKLADFRRRQQALENLAKLITTGGMLYHKETALNLLGWMLKREGNLKGATWCFVYSIKLEPKWNAAKWHIADIYLQVHLERSNVRAIEYI